MLTETFLREHRTRQLDLLINICFVLGKSLLEHVAQLIQLGLESLLARPGLFGVQDVTGHTLNSLGNGEVEDGEVFVLGFGERAVVDGVDNSSRVLERASFAGTKLATSPTSVYQPTVDTVLLHPFSEHLGVPAGVEDDEGLTVTCREGWGGLDDTIFSTGGLGGVTSDEVVLSLLGGKSGDGGKDTEGVATEHNDVRGLTVCDTGDFGVRDVLDGVGTSSVLGDGNVVVVGFTIGGVVDNIFEDRAKLDGIEDLGFLQGQVSGCTNGKMMLIRTHLFGREVDALGVTATLNVKDTSVTPDVLIVTN